MRRILVVEDETKGASFTKKAWALRDRGAEVVVGHRRDLDAMHRVMAGGETMDFGRSVSDASLAATGTAAAVAKHHGVQAFINMSPMTLAQMRMTETTASPQHQRHWLAEQALHGSGLPVVHVRPTVLLEGFILMFTADSVRESHQSRLPFGEGQTSPVAVEGVARVIAARLANPQPHLGKIDHLTGPQSENMHCYAQEYSKALGRTITCQDMPGAVAGRAARARLASPGEPPRDDGRCAPRGTLRPDVGRRAHAHGVRAAERAGDRPEACGDMHRVGNRGLRVCGGRGARLVARATASHAGAWEETTWHI